MPFKFAVLARARLPRSLLAVVLCVAIGLGVAAALHRRGDAGQRPGSGQPASVSRLDLEAGAAPGAAPGSGAPLSPAADAPPAGTPAAASSARAAVRAFLAARTRGDHSTPNYASLASAAIHTLKGGTKVFAGQRDDPFFVDLGSVFDLAGLRPFNQAHLIKLPTAPGRDGVSGYNTHTIALQVPITGLTHNHKKPASASDPNAVIGVYATSQRRQVRALSASGWTPSQSGKWVQVSRLGMPLVNEVVIPLGKKDRFNASDPTGDTQFLPFVQNPEPARLIPVLYPGVQVPAAPRSDITTIFLTGIPGLNQPKNVRPSEMIRLNVAIPPSAHPRRLIPRDGCGDAG